jgi:hypothetical protein
MVYATSRRIAHVEVKRAAADFLVRGEGDPHRSMRDFGMGDKKRDGAHDFGDAGLVVGAEQRQAGRGDDVVTELFAGAPGYRRDVNTAVGSSGNTRSRPS